MVDATAPQPAGVPDAEQVLAALDRVLASRELARAPRSRDFLAYVVTETLAGRAEQLSERTVGRRALGHGADFSGAETAAVRVRASRVRAALTRYYQGEGRDDPLRISVPPGRYVAVFERLDQERPRTAPQVPGVAVVELAASGPSPARPLAASLSDALALCLAQHPTITVIGPTSLVDSDVRATGAALGVSTVLDGRVVVQDERIGFTVRLLSSSTGQVLWSAAEVLTRDELASFRPEDAWTREVAAQIGDVTGLVVRQELPLDAQGDAEPEVAARLAFYSYVDLGTVDSILEATARLDRALEVGPRTASLVAMRAAIANAAQIYGIGDRDAQLDLAAALAREALSLDGTSAHAHLVLGSVARDRGQWDLALEHAEAAVALAPHQPSYLVGAGITASGAGAWDRGGALLREAHRLHPGLAGHTHAWLAVNHLVHADHARALSEASLLPAGGGYVWGPLYRAMALAGLGHIEQARAEARLAEAMRPEILADPAAYFSGRMRLTDEQLAHLLRLIDAASG